MAAAKDDAALAPGRAGDPRNTRFIPRNFLSDERIDSSRAGQYALALPPGRPGSFDDWNAAHNFYLAGRVFLPPPASHDYHAVPADNPRACPETFRSRLALTAFEATDLDTDFIRMVAVSDIAWRSGRREEEIFALGEQVIRDPVRPTTAGDVLAIILEEAFLGPMCDHRPVFAAFYEDFLDDVRDPVDTTWPNKLRDRLGLFHINQWLRPLPRHVFLFRYTVRELPRLQGDLERRPIAVPGVLDHRLSEAFCPAPQELDRGQCVNLEANSQSQPAREVLHLFMPLEPKHLFRVGTVTSPVPDYLGPARRDHLIWLRLLSGRENFAAQTDADLFQP